MPDYPEGGINRVSAGASGTKIFFTGGQTQTTTSAKTFAFNLSTNAWEPQQDKPTPIHSSSKLIYDGTSTLYAFGGQASTTPTAVTEAILTITKPVIKVNTAGIISTLQVNTSRKYSFMISNSGSANLIWNGSIEPSSVKWATLNPVTGNIAADNSQNASVDISANGLSTGDYTASVKVTSNDPDPNRSVISIPINLHVQTDPADVQRKILLEECTGMWCQWCPYGADSVKAILARYPNEVVSIAYHNADAMSTPLESEIENFLSVPYYPSGFVNRIKFPGNINVVYDRGMWGYYIDSLLGVNSYSTIQISFSNKIYNQSTKQMSLTLNVKFLQAINPVRVNIVQSESGFNWWQQKGADKIFPYIHNHVVRLVIPNVPGEVVTTNPTIIAGYTFAKDFTFKSNDSVAANCKLVVIVHQTNGTTAGEVLQTLEEPLLLNSTAITTAVYPNDYSLAQNYPNPFNPSTMINYDVPKNSFVSIKVYNVLGKQVATLVNEINDPGSYSVNWNAKGMSSGMYYYTLEAGTTSITRRMTLLK